MAEIRHYPPLKFNYNCKFAQWITSKQRVPKMKLPARHLLMASCCILWEKSKGEVQWWPKRTSLYSDTFFGFAAGQESTWCISLVVVLCTMFNTVLSFFFFFFNPKIINFVVTISNIFCLFIFGDWQMPVTEYLSRVVVLKCGWRIVWAEKLCRVELGL